MTTFERGDLVRFQDVHNEGNAMAFERGGKYYSYADLHNKICEVLEQNNSLVTVWVPELGFEMSWYSFRFKYANAK
jgi:hypothetical protein